MNNNNKKNVNQFSDGNLLDLITEKNDLYILCVNLNVLKINNKI